jgi:hypothetical protein
MRRALVFVVSLFCLPAFGQIYKYTDANGNTVYSEHPPAGKPAQQMQLPPLNSVQMPKGKAPPSAPEQPAPPPAVATPSAYATLELTDLPADGAIRANNGTFEVGVNIQPRLAGGRLLQLVLDGVAYGTPSNVPRLQLVNIDRGEHSLAVQVLEGADVVQTSASRTIYVLRVSAP